MADDNAPTALATALAAAPPIPAPESPAADTPTTATEEAPPRTYATWKEAVADADLNELVKEERIAGKLGDLAEKRAQALREQITREERARAEKQRLDNLLEEDPWKYKQEIDRMKAEIAAQTQRQADQEERLAQTTSRIHGQVAGWIAGQFPPEVVTQLAGKTYTGSYEEGLVQYLDDATRLARQHWTAAERAHWEEDARPALRKQLLAELNGGTRPDLDGGAATAGAGVMTQAEWDRNRQDTAWRKANRERINAGLAARTITH